VDVEDSGPVLWLPDVAFVPLQLPDAEQLVALVEDHERVALPPLVTLVGDAESCTVGAGGGDELVNTRLLTCHASPPPVELLHVWGSLPGALP
jgi:hypothetical protein